MNTRKSLIALAGALSFYFLGCKDVSEYYYDGKIGDDSVTFIENKSVIFNNERIMVVRKTDGRVIRYFDYHQQDFKLEKVEIQTGKQVKRYTGINDMEREILKEAQKQFDSYLEKIKEINKNTTLKSTRQ